MPARCFPLCLVSLGLLLGAPPARAAEPFATLLQDYKSYGLPLPPHDAELAHLPAPQVSWSNGVRRQDVYLVLLVGKGPTPDRTVYWAGCDEGGHWHSIEFHPVQPERASFTKTAPLPVDHWRIGFPTYPDLALAIQCHALGWEELAQALLERSKHPEQDRSRRPPRPRDDRKALAQLAWNYHCNLFVRQGADRRAIVARMKQLLTAGPGLDVPARRRIVEDMEKTLVKPQVPPTGLAANLEDLLGFYGAWQSCHGRREQEPPRDVDRLASYRKLQEAGLGAVPLLLQHLDDFRLTRDVQTNDHGSYVWHVRIADLVARLLNDIAGEEFAYDLLEREGRGVRVDRAHVQDWWKRVGGTNELDYLRQNLERKPKFGRTEGNPAVLQALGTRYPDELRKLFAERLKTGALDDNWYEALEGSKVPAADKLQLLLAGAKNEDEWQQIFALRVLARSKNAEAKKLLVAALDRQPVTPKEAYWTGNLSKFAQIGASFDDDGVWQALLKTARRVDVGQRLELLDWVGPGRNGGRIERAIRFFAAFLDDDTIRDNKSSKLFEGPGAAFSHQRIAVRDFAALQLAHLLELKVDDEPTWGEAEWGQLRVRVAAELAKRAKKDQ